jgi:hypothetical protein
MRMGSGRRWVKPDRMGPVGAGLHAVSLGSIGLCLALWIRAKTVDQEERGNAERRALFVGLWPPMLWLLGDTVREFAGARPGARRWPVRKC